LYWSKEKKLYGYGDILKITRSKFIIKHTASLMDEQRDELVKRIKILEDRYELVERIKILEERYGLVKRVKILEVRHDLLQDRIVNLDEEFADMNTVFTWQGALFTMVRFAWLIIVGATITFVVVYVIAFAGVLLLKQSN